MTPLRVLTAFDKFRGTLTAQQANAVVQRVCAARGISCTAMAIADGGEGTLEAFGGPNQHTQVPNALGNPVQAAWRLDGRFAVIETARASGLEQIGGRENNSPMLASSTGTGLLIRAAMELGATSILVGMGGSATTDGGKGAVEVLRDLRGIDLRVACDVTTGFLDAARVFAPQKGADPDQVEQLSIRLAQLAVVYHQRHGVDVTSLPGSGAAGGLAGGLAAIGAILCPGFSLVATQVGLHAALERTDLVFTGEGQVDATSWQGKVVGGMLELAGDRVQVIAGRVLTPHPQITSLFATHGERALTNTAACLEAEVGRILGTTRLRSP